MFVGHLALALGAKRVAPAASLGWLIAAVIALDLLWPIFLLLGLEQVRVAPGATAFTPFVFESYPWSHSLVMAVIWGGVLAVIARSRRVPAPAWLIVVLVVSHWVLDVATHAPDMPLWPTTSSPKFGFGLWDSVPLTLAVEGSMWLAAIALYLRTRPARSRGARLAFWSLVAVTTVLWVSGPWSPPPAEVGVLAWVALAGGLVTIPWAAAADRVQPRIG